MPIAQQSASAEKERNKKIALAISSLVAGAGGTASAQEAGKVAVEEITVTATRREENLQDVPQSVLAFSEHDIKRQNLNSLEDYARFIPSMSYVSVSPGFSKITFRGVSDSPSPFIAQSSAALYLDDQPLTQGSANPDPRMVDIERIEALSGPQATLYGDSSQSGTLRIITNKPDPNEFDSWVDATLRTMSEGEESYDVSGMVNIPLAENKFAVRLVGFVAQDGGFIDNVLGTAPFGGVDTSTGPLFFEGPNGEAATLLSGTTDNANAVKDDVNRVEYSGARIAAKWFINEKWDITAGYVFQNTDAKGWNNYDPTVGDLKMVRFFDETREDEWGQIALTINGDLGFADFVSSTAYFSRDAQYTLDATSYTSYFGLFCYAYYADSSYVFAPAYCFAPNSAQNGTVVTNEVIGFATNIQDNTRLTQEFRFSHEGPKFKWVAGLFYEDKSEEWDYWARIPGYANSPAFAYWDANYTLDPAAVDEAWWHSGDETTWEQWAVFGEFTYDFNDKWSMTAGGRYYSSKFDKFYFVERPNSRPDVQSGTPVGVSRPSGDDNGFLPKLSIKYNITDDKMVYALYSEGFRAGGTNRGRGDPNIVVTPNVYDADLLKNYELGAKTRWADGRLQVNATLFHMSWEDYQFELNDPSFSYPAEFRQPFQTVVANAGDAVIDGFELGIRAVLGHGWDAGFDATWLNSKTDGDINLCRFEDNPVLLPICLANAETIPDGTDLPMSPDFKASAFGQYTWQIGSLTAFGRLQYSYTGESFNIVGEGSPAFPKRLQEAYSITDLKFGLQGEDWEANLFLNNITDERAQIYRNSDWADAFWGNERVSVNRPMEIGVRYFKRF